MQDIVKNLICTIEESGWSQTVYLSAIVLGIVLAMCYSVWYGKKIGMKPYKTVIAVSLGSTLVLVVMELLKQVIDLFLGETSPIMNSFLNNMGRSFVFVPLIALIISWMLRIEWRKICSVFSFTEPIIWGTASLGCLVPGCCKGYAWSRGIYHYWTKEYVFPTQLLNAMLLWLVACYLLKRTRQQNYALDGKEYPIMLVLVGLIRFFTEFLMDNEKIVLGCSSLSFDALIMCCVGGIALLVIHVKDSMHLKKISSRG